jgi:Protein of unknown function (DUF3501)
VEPLTLEDVYDLERYEAIREPYRRAILTHKQARRLAVGDRVTVVFEDRETVRWQVLEMARVERIRDAAQLQHELDVYNALLPGADSLSATLFIEITEVAAIRPELDRLIGIDEHLSLVLGDGAAALAVRARFDADQMDEERISAVHYVRFPLAGPARAAFLDPSVPARLRIDHPSYAASAELPPAMRESLRRDLAGGAPPLLGAVAPPPSVAEAAASRSGAADALVAEGVRVRVLRPARTRAPGHLVLEARGGERFAEADGELLAELAAFAQRHARELADRHGGCRLEADLAGPLRWHLLAP